MRPPTATKRRGGVKPITDTQASGSGSQPSASSAARRRGQSRASSVASDISFGDGASTEEPRKSARTRQGASSTTTRSRKNAVIIEESEEEEGVDFTPSGAGESTREDFGASHQPTSTAAAASTSRRTVTTASKRNTQLPDASSGSSESRRMASRQLGGLTPSMPSASLRGRKALVIDDDDEEDEGTPGTATVRSSKRRLFASLTTYRPRRSCRRGDDLHRHACIQCSTDLWDVSSGCPPPTFSRNQTLSSSLFFGFRLSRTPFVVVARHLEGSWASSVRS